MPRFLLVGLANSLSCYFVFSAFVVGVRGRLVFVGGNAAGVIFNLFTTGPIGVFPCVAMMRPVFQPSWR